MPGAEALKASEWTDLGYRKAALVDRRIPLPDGDRDRPGYARGAAGDPGSLQARRIAAAPVNDVAGGAPADQQLAERGFFRTVDDVLLDRKVTYPGPPYQLADHSIPPGPPLPRPAVRPTRCCATGSAPRTGSSPSCGPTGLSRERDPGPPAGPGLPACIGAGALVTQTLALHGAEVIKIESRPLLDNLRVAPPVRPGTSGLDASGNFASRNAGKKSFALNLTHPDAIAIAQRLAAASSVVTSNFRPGVMERWSLSYADLGAGRTDLIYLTMPMQGANGPHSRYAGSARPSPPSPAWSRRPDCRTGFRSAPARIIPPCPESGSRLVALLAALVHRNRTGRGGRIELSQFESTAGLLGPAMIRYSVTGQQPAPRGNRVPWAAPHGVYPCLGDDNWIAISAGTEAQWAALSASCSQPARPGPGGRRSGHRPALSPFPP